MPINVGVFIFLVVFGSASTYYLVNFIKQSAKSAGDGCQDRAYTSDSINDAYLDNIDLNKDFDDQRQVSRGLIGEMRLNRDARKNRVTNLQYYNVTQISDYFSEKDKIRKI